MTDRSARFQHWFQLITNVAILFGLGLVVYELNQSKQLASAQFVIDDMARETSIQLAMMGEDPREALAKAALHPADLNERDVVALDAYYLKHRLRLVQLRRSTRSSPASICPGGRSWQTARRSFSSEPARRWLRAWAADQDDRFRPDGGCRDRGEGSRRRFGQLRTEPATSCCWRTTEAEECEAEKSNRLGSGVPVG